MDQLRKHGREGQDFARLADEHHVLMSHHGHVQARCSELVRAQAAEIERLQAQAMHLRATVIVRDTVLAWAREDRIALEASIPGLPKRLTLARHIETLLARIRDLTYERRGMQPHPATLTQVAVDAMLPDQPGVTAAGVEYPDDRNLGGLESSLAAADLVICQTGCLSHGEYWRVQDHCKRCGKICVLVEQPDALRIVRIHRTQPETDIAANLRIDAKEN